MATLQNINGASLSANVAGAFADGLGPYQERQRETQATSELENLIRGSLGIGGPAPQPQKPAPGTGLLGRLAPGIAQAISNLQGNPEGAAELRTETNQGIALATELQKLPDHASRVRRLAEEGGKMVSAGQDISRVTQLSNLSPGQLDLELMKMQMVGKETIAQLPQEAAIAGVMARNPALGSSLLGRRDRQIAAEKARRRAAQKPQGEFAKGMAQINRNEKLGHISPEDAEARRAVLRGKYLTDPSVAAGLEIEQDRADLTKTQAEIDNIKLENAGLEIEQNADPEFDPESPEGKVVGDRAGLVEIFGEGSPLVAHFDTLATPEPSAAEAKISRITGSFGVDMATAQGIADGVIVTSRNEVTGETSLLNKATGELRVLEPTNGAQDEEATLPPEITGAVEPSSGDPNSMFGVQGAALNALNSVTDAIFGGQVSEPTDQAIQSLSNLNTRTMLALSAEFPGRPSNLTREKIEALSPVPASIFTGKGRAVTQLTQMRSLVADAILGADTVANGRGNYLPADRGASAKSLNQLLPIWRDYNTLIEKLGADGGEGDGVVSVTDQAAFDKLPSGTKFKLPGGETGTKK
jgi:hypothetical protein